MQVRVIALCKGKEPGPLLSHRSPEQSVRVETPCMTNTAQACVWAGVTVLAWACAAFLYSAADIAPPSQNMKIPIA
jgi:hypothetical protein